MIESVFDPNCSKRSNCAAGSSGYNIGESTAKVMQPGFCSCDFGCGMFLLIGYSVCVAKPITNVFVNFVGTISDSRDPNSDSYFGRQQRSANTNTNPNCCIQSNFCWIFDHLIDHAGTDFICNIEPATFFFILFFY